MGDCRISRRTEFELCRKMLITLCLQSQCWRKGEREGEEREGEPIKMTGLNYRV